MVKKYKKEGYKVIARDYATLYFHLAAYVEASGTTSKDVIGVKDNSLAILTENGFWKYSAKIKKWLRLGRVTLKRLEDPTFFKRVYQKQKVSCRMVAQYTRIFRTDDLRRYTDRQLASGYAKAYRIWLEMNKWGQVPNLADFEHFLLTEKIMDFLKERCSGKSISAGEAFGLLVAPIEQSPLAHYEIDFYEVLALIQSRATVRQLFTKKKTSGIELQLKRYPKVYLAIRRLVDKYDWMQYHYDGPTILDRDYFIEMLASEVRQRVEGKMKVAELRRYLADTKQQQKKVERFLELTQHEKYWVRVARAFGYLKALRKDTVFIGSRNSDQLFTELGRRLQISRTQARYMSPEEAQLWLKRGEADVGLLNNRYRYSVLYADSKRLYIVTGKRAKELGKLFYEEEVRPNIKELTGTSAYPGKVTGRVRIIIHADDMKDMKKGDILVSPATNPNVVPAMKIAGAIVTDEGGVTCHAAIVSRELKKPCVIGTKIATKVFKNGDRVEVDATKGIVKKI